MMNHVHRRKTRALSCLLTLLLECNRLGAQNPPRPPLPEQQLKDVVNDVHKALKSPNMPVVLPWSLTQRWAEDQLTTNESARRWNLLGASRLYDLVRRDALLADLSAQVQRTRLGLQPRPAPLQVLVPEILFPEASAGQEALGRSIIENTSNAGLSQTQGKVLQNASDSMRRSSLRALLNPTSMDQSLDLARNAGNTLRSVLTAAGVRDETKVVAEMEKVRQVLSVEAQRVLDKVPKGISAADYQIVKIAKLADIANALPSKKLSPSSGPLPKIEEATQLVAAFGQFDRAQEQFRTFATEARTVADRLKRDIEAAKGDWRSRLDAYRSGARTLADKGVVPREVENIGTFVSDFAQVQDMLRGGISGLGDPKAAALLNFGASKGILSPQVVGGINTLMTMKGDYANAALGLASALNISPPNEIKSLLPIAMTAASLFSGAGPLMALGGFGGGGGALGALGALGGGGGGPDYSKDFADIKNQLADMNKTLKNIEKQLDDLSADIARNHQEVMFALEALSYDQFRTQQLLLAGEHRRVNGPCAIANQGGAEAGKDECDKSMALLWTQSGLPEVLSLRANIGWKGVKQDDSALQFMREEQASRRYLATLFDDSKVNRDHATGKMKLGATPTPDDCGGLISPSRTLVDLEAKRSAAFSSRMQISAESRIPCSSLLLRQPELVEPGILSKYVRDELDALLHWDGAIPLKRAVQWWSQNRRGEYVRERWIRELGLLDDAVAQQAIMSGDVVLEAVAAAAEAQSNAKWLLRANEIDGLAKAKDEGQRLADEQTARMRVGEEEAEPLDRFRNLRKVWGGNNSGILAANVARFWVWSRLRNNSAPRTLYAIAWKSSGDDRLWRSFLGTHDSSVAFRWTEKEAAWSVVFPGLAPVRLPSPQEWESFELRWPDALTELVAVRKRLRDELTGIEYLRNLRLNSSAKPDVLEAFGIARTR